MEGRGLTETKYKTSDLFSVKVSVTQSCLTLCDPWTVARQAPLPMGFSRQEYWNGVPFPTLEDLPDPGIESTTCLSPTFEGKFFATSATWKCIILTYMVLLVCRGCHNNVQQNG